MLIADYIAKILSLYGVTDAFGIPGGVVLDMMYALAGTGVEIQPHLLYNEQTVGFAACGYAQTSKKLGVAYATRGPGIMNMLTSMAEAYQESIPVLFLTAHGERIESEKRFENNQEVNLKDAVSSYTKYAANVETVSEVIEHLQKAICCALSGRKGPVFLDIKSNLFSEKIDKLWVDNIKTVNTGLECSTDRINEILDVISAQLKKSIRPVILIGDGLRYIYDKKKLKECLEQIQLPILSSRGAQDIAASSQWYYGYIGSHGLRYSNFILSKADLIISIGNRLAFPKKSKSFGTVMESKTIIRIDIDANELGQQFPQVINRVADFNDLIEPLCKRNICFKDINGWLDICRKLREKLEDYDVSEPVKKIAEIMNKKTEDTVYVTDVGNNEFWFSRAYEKCRRGEIYTSKAFGTLGVALGKAIGAYYGTHKEIVCVIGDQGMQFNIQELQYISYWKLPITILLINNGCSGMIKESEMRRCGMNYLHVDKESGYTVPNFKAVSKSYEIDYATTVSEVNDAKPVLYEILIDSEVFLTPYIPKGEALQKMHPTMPEKLYQELNEL